jgi:type IV pilus assembly protein PilN
VIRINLLGNERAAARKGLAFDSPRQVTAICAAIALATALGVGWWHWSLTQQSARIDEEIAAATAEQTRMRTLLAELGRFEARRATLQQRVQLIEQLRGGQSVPVQLLDHVSRSLPDMLWLTALTQDGDVMTIEGRSTTLFALSDFVGNLGNSPLLQKPIEIVNSQVEPAPPAQARAQSSGPAQELIRFTVKAQMAKTPAKPATPAGAPGAPATPSAATAAAAAAAAPGA